MMSSAVEKSKPEDDQQPTVVIPLFLIIIAVCKPINIIPQYSNNMSDNSSFNWYIKMWYKLKKTFLDITTMKTKLFPILLILLRS